MTSAILNKPFTNEFGQEIQPGDTVVMVASGYNHSVRIRRGTYVGLREDRRGDVESVVVKYPTTVTRWASDYKSHWKEDVVKQTTLPLMRIYKLDTHCPTSRASVDDSDRP